MPIRPRGARRSPAHEVMALAPHLAAPAPSYFSVVPPRLSYWGNDRYGICTSAESAFAKAAYSMMVGLPETFILEDTLIAWAEQRGYLWGATLLEVMRDMRTDGIRDEHNDLYHNGPPSSVNWSDHAALSSAIFQGPVKIGVAADQLDDVVRGSNGWYSGNFHVDRNMDHCVSLCGYGTVAQMFDALKVRAPSNANLSETAYLMFTWRTIGVITAQSMRNITAEAYVRNPTTREQQQVPTTPTTITLTSAPNPSMKDEPVALTATVTGESGTPTGTVSFLDGGTVFSTVNLSGTSAHTVTPYFGVGTHHLTAKYNGDPSHESSTSSTVYQTVNTDTPEPEPEPPASNVTVTYDPATNTVILGGVTVKQSD